MRKNAPQTPLLALLRVLSENEREALAADAGTTVLYLYALATCQRDACRADLALAIENATRRMREATLERTPVVTMQELATMCVLAPET